MPIPDPCVSNGVQYQNDLFSFHCRVIIERFCWSLSLPLIIERFCWSLSLPLILKIFPPLHQTNTLDMRIIARCFYSCAAWTTALSRAFWGRRSRRANYFRMVTARHVRQVKGFNPNLDCSVRLKAVTIRKKTDRKHWLRKVHHFLTETKQLADISVRRIKMLF